MSKNFRRDSITHASKVKTLLPDYESEEKSRKAIAEIRQTLGVQGNRHERNQREGKRPDGNHSKTKSY